jgi:ZIP family zinc transporter
MLGEFGRALGVTALAGMATMIGAFLALVVRRPGAKTLSLSTGFAAGVMIFVSFAGFLHHSLAAAGQAVAYLCFFAGMGFMFLLDVMIPHDYLAEHHDRGRDSDGAGESGEGGKPRFVRIGLLAALGIGIHNFPEGMAVFTGMLHGTESLGLAVAVAIALHNIPEGLAVAAPVYAGTGSRGKALGWCLLASLAEPAGALLAAAVLYPILSPAVMAGTLAAVAGVMVFISLDELLPAAQNEEAGHLGIVGVLGGMAVMAVGLWMLHAAEPHGHEHGPACSHGAQHKGAPADPGKDGHDHEGECEHESHDH